MEPGVGDGSHSHWAGRHHEVALRLADAHLTPVLAAVVLIDAEVVRLARVDIVRVDLFGDLGRRLRMTDAR